MTNEKLLSLGLELLLLAALGGAYYLWQRRRIIYGPRGWRSSRLVEAHHLALNCDHPESFKDLVAFIESCESLLGNPDAVMSDEFIARWLKADLPPEVLALLDECDEWAHPKI